MFYRCTFCDKTAQTLRDQNFGECRENNHQIVSFLDKKNLAEVKKHTDDSDAKKCHDYIKPKLLKTVISAEDRNAVYSLVENEDKLELLHLQSSRACQWVSYTYRKYDPDIRPDSWYDIILENIIAEAQMNGTPTEQIYLRVAQLDDVFYYNLANEKGELVKITRNGVELIQYGKDLPLFRRSQTTSKQYMPDLDATNDSLENYVKLFNLQDDDEEKLFVVNLIAMLLEKCAIPIPFWDGHAGSFKSTSTAMIKMLIDPAGYRPLDNRQSIPEEDNDAILSLSDQYLIAFDNMSKITQERSDILCRAITGATSSKRKLYTDSTQVLTTIIRKITGNGVSPELNNFTDLMDRIIIYDRKPIAECKRMTDSELEKKISTLIPGALGFSFKILSKAMNYHDEVKSELPNPKTRLADFEIWGEAIGRSLGWREGEFLDLFYGKRTEGAVDNKQYHPLVEIIEAVYKNNGQSKIEETVKKWHELVTQHIVNDQINTDNLFLPKNEAQFGKQFRKICPILISLGYYADISRYRKNDKRFTKGASVIKIEKIPSLTSLPSLVSQSLLDHPNFMESSGESNTILPSPLTWTKSDTNGDGESGDGKFLK